MKTLTELGIGHSFGCFIVAEAGINHNGDYDMALSMIDSAAEFGADAVKFQTFQAKNYISSNTPQAEYMKNNASFKGTQLELLEKYELKKKWHKGLINRCQEKGIIFLSTPFENESYKYLTELNLPIIKISSGDLTNTPFLSKVAHGQAPVILSTGMSNLAEIYTATETLKLLGKDKLVLLHCVSKYPANPEDVNLRAMDTIKNSFKLPVGYSDHTTGNEVSIAAVSRGACIIEKHFTLDKHLPGPDHKASCEPNQFRELVKSIRSVEKSLGTGIKQPSLGELEIAAVARKSIVFRNNLKAGSILSEQDLCIMRPGTGLCPNLINVIIGRKLRSDVKYGQLVTLNLLI